MGRGRGGAPPRGWWPSGLASVSLKRVVPGSVPPWRAPCFAWPRCGFGLPGVDFRAPAVVFTSGRKHGSDALARLKRPCCSGAPFFFRRQARSSKLEAGKPQHLLLKRFARAVSSRTFSVKPLLPGLFSLRGKIRGSNAACQLLCRSPLAVAPVLRNFAAGRPPLFFLAPGLLSCAGREWKLALGSGSWVGGIEIETFD